MSSSLLTLPIFSKLPSLPILCQVKKWIFVKKVIFLWKMVKRKDLMWDKGGGKKPRKEEKGDSTTIGLLP